VLNKADIPIQHLLRVYGALMWSLGKVIKTPEVLRVYIGSFWDGPLKETDNAKLLQAEQADLLADLRALPRGSTVRKINELVKRARMAKVHAHLLNHIRSKFGMFGKKKDQAKMLEDANLAEISARCNRRATCRRVISPTCAASASKATLRTVETSEVGEEVAGADGRRLPLPPVRFRRQRALALFSVVCFLLVRKTEKCEIVWTIGMKIPQRG
jgi:hypothetical protein